MDLETFKKQVEVIRRECQVTTISRLSDPENWGAAHDPPLTVITVDDGYADFYHVAWPVLREAGIPATVFLTVDFIGKRTWMWPDALEYLIFKADSGSHTVNAGDSLVTLVLTDADSRRRAWDDLASRLLLDNSARERVIAQLQEVTGVKLPTHPTEEYEPLTWEQVREMAAGGVEIGSHTLSHAFIPGLPPDQRRHELVESKRQLEEVLGRKVHAFAYPNGSPADSPDFLCAEIESAGYRTAVVCSPPDAPRVIDRYRVGRWPATDDFHHFLNIVHGASMLRRWIRSYSGRLVGWRRVKV